MVTEVKCSTQAGLELLCLEDVKENAILFIL